MQAVYSNSTKRIYSASDGGSAVCLPLGPLKRFQSEPNAPLRSFDRIVVQEGYGKKLVNEAETIAQATTDRLAEKEKRVKEFRRKVQKRLIINQKSNKNTAAYVTKIEEKNAEANPLQQLNPKTRRSSSNKLSMKPVWNSCVSEIKLQQAEVHRQQMHRERKIVQMKAKGKKQLEKHAKKLLLIKLEEEKRLVLEAEKIDKERAIKLELKHNLLKQRNEEHVKELNKLNRKKRKQDEFLRYVTATYSSLQDKCLDLNVEMPKICPCDHGKSSSVVPLWERCAINCEFYQNPLLFSMAISQLSDSLEFCV